MRTTAYLLLAGAVANGPVTSMHNFSHGSFGRGISVVGYGDLGCDFSDRSHGVHVLTDFSIAESMLGHQYVLGWYRPSVGSPIFVIAP